MEFIEASADIAPAACDRDSVIAAVGPGKTIIGRIAIDPQDASITIEMAGNAIACAAILEAIGNHRGPLPPNVRSSRATGRSGSIACSS
jgi:hypothetical protein